MTINGLPVYKLAVTDDESTGVDFISLVDNPAIETNWVAMKENVRMKFDADQQMLHGPVMIPDLPIYRFDEGIGEYYVIFDKQTIADIRKKFFKAQKTLSFNYMHQPGSSVDAVIVDSWLTGKVDKSQSFGFDLPEGTWFISAHVEDQGFWNKEIKSGNVRGFSIEGFLKLIMSKKNKMNQTFVQAKTQDGTYTMGTDAETFAVGVDVYTVNEDGSKGDPSPDGEYLMENGSTIVVSGGKVSEIREEEMITEEQADELMNSLQSRIDKVIQAAIAPIQKELEEVKAKFNKPAAASATSKTDTPAPTKAEKFNSTIEKIKQFKKQK